MAAMSNHASSGDNSTSDMCPMSQRRPSPVSNERTPSTIMADNSHDSSTSRHHATAVSTAMAIRSLLFIGVEIVDVEDMEFQCPHHEAGSIHATGVLEETLHEIVLTFLQALYAEGHAT